MRFFAPLLRRSSCVLETSGKQVENWWKLVEKLARTCFMPVFVLCEFCASFAHGRTKRKQGLLFSHGIKVGVAVVGSRDLNVSMDA